MKHALLSVSDKTGIVEFARGLVELGFTILSTGGTFRAITDGGVPATYVSDVTAHPEVFDGRVKTLHPKIHGGILYRRDLDSHVHEAAEYQIPSIDVVAVNLYPFRETIAKPDVGFQDAIENIDIGGPAMVRAAAKNHASVLVVTSPNRYKAVLDALTEGEANAGFRRELALEAFRHTASYDAAISQWLGDQTSDAEHADMLARPHWKVDDLRYGENPHQSAALYRDEGHPPLRGAEVLQGKALSYNNLVDLDGAVAAVLEFDEPAAVVVKHTNPCGVGRHESELLRAYERALAGDPVSAFGGIVALNRRVEGSLAEKLSEIFLEVIAATGFSDEARDVLSKKKNLRLIDFDPAKLDHGAVHRHTLFGRLVQSPDPRISDLDETWTVATTRQPTEEEATALRFLWRVCKHVKSNAIVVGRHDRTLGVGAGQMSRVDAVELAVKKATGSLDGAALASDAFFPFRDGLDAAAKVGVRAVIQPGGSRRDAEVIEAANEHGIAMVFTGHRHFRH